MIVYRIILIILSLTTVKCLQAHLSVKLGDPTAKASRRLSVNPLVHIDIFGTVILPLVLLILSRGMFTFGYAKHLAFNQYHFKQLHRDRLLLSATILLGHIAIGIIAVLLLPIIPWVPLREPLLFLTWTNTLFVFFNLIPIPPLEGANILASLLPPRMSHSYLKLERYGPTLIAILFMLGIIPGYVRLTAESLLYPIYGF